MKFNQKIILGLLLAMTFNFNISAEEIKSEQETTTKEKTVIRKIGESILVGLIAGCIVYFGGKAFKSK
jgi:hypothetical protein